MESKRCVLFYKAGSEEEAAYKEKMLHDYADANGYIITMSLDSEESFLQCREEYDVVLCADTLLLPITNVKIIRI